ncbi:MAG TPA: peptidylprolyl isomerase [Actinomycetota bacterium]|nr:peptidylprolyl isomerase [Actinomycetota bacterium]
MSKRSRDRQLAKLAARRQAERTAALRRRNLIVGILAGVVALVVVVVGLSVLLGDDPETAAPTPTPASPSGSPSPSVEPGTKTGTVTPTAATESGEVACGADEPAKAGEPKPQFAGPPPMDVDRKGTYTATMRTSCGAIVIELDPQRAPQTVNSFVFLAEKGYFDGQYVHRLDTSIDVIQGGDPSGDGTGGPGYAIPDELTGDESYTPGTLAMANAGANSGGSQFFLITGPAGTNLDGSPNYTIFGKVIEGLDVAQRIQKLPIVDPDSGDISGQRPAEAVYIESVTIKRSGGGG